MSKLKKEFKNEVDREIREGSYAARQIGKKVLVAVLVITVLGGVFGVGYTLTIEKWQKNAERSIQGQCGIYGAGG